VASNFRRFFLFFVLELPLVNIIYVHVYMYVYSRRPRSITQLIALLLNIIPADKVTLITIILKYGLLSRSRRFD